VASQHSKASQNESQRAREANHTWGNSMISLQTLVKRGLSRIGLLPSPGDEFAGMKTLDVREAYRLWAPTYAAETAASYLDERLAHAMLAGLPQTHLLDAGCGTGRRIAHISGAIGIDASPEMLAVGDARNVVTGDVNNLPFESDRFDMVWCRLVLGHLPDPLSAYFELARVCTPGGYVFVTDFHPDAASAGHRRSFTDEVGNAYEVEHYVHNDHIDLAMKAGLTVVSRRDGAVGPSVRDFYLRGIGMKAYKRDLGLNLVAAFLFCRSG
jgi:malonyl-CoA O-methyltransferase